jgi:putative spermidine/putrescine transport system substrate-binding protein
MNEKLASSQAHMGLVLRRRDLFKALGLSVGGALSLHTAAASASPAAPMFNWFTRQFAGHTLQVHHWSGPDGDNIQRNVTDPFKDETGADVVVDYGYTSAGIAKLRAQKDDPQIDVMFFDDIGVVTTGNEGLLTILDVSRVPNAADIDQRFFINNGMGIGFFTYSTSIVYNTNYFPSPPESWEILWSPDLKDQVGLPSAANADALKLVIMAAKLAGGDQFNADAAWPKLAGLKPNVHSFVEDYAAAAELLKSGDMKAIVLTTYVFKGQQDKGYPIAVDFGAREGYFSASGCAAIPAGHPGDQTLTELYVNKALSPEAQQGMAAGQYFGPTNSRVHITDPKIAANVVTPDMVSTTVPVDLARLNTDRQDWITRYDQTLKG